MKTVKGIVKWIALTALLLVMVSPVCVTANQPSVKTVSELDGTKIERVKVVWLTPDSAKTADGAATPAAELEAKEHLFLSAVSNIDINMVYRITVDFSGQHDYKPGDITIKIPARVWHARKLAEEDGQSVGSVDEDKYIGTLDLPLPKFPSTKADFNWQIVNDQYVITNTCTIGATSSISIDVGVCGFKAADVVDMSECDPIIAQCEVITNQKNTIEMASEPIVAQLDTVAKITEANKAGTVFEDYSNLPSALQIKLPANTDVKDYVYVRWASYPTVQASQPYSLKMQDVLSYAYEEVPDGNGGVKRQKVSEGIFLGCANCEGQIPGENGSDFSSVINNYSTANGALHGNALVLWSAYPKSDFYVPGGNEPQRAYYFENEAVWTVTEVDGPADNDSYGKPADERKTTIAKKTAVVKYAPIKWGTPNGRFKVLKGTRVIGSKDYTYGYALNHLENGANAVMEFAVKTIGYGYPWTSAQTKGYDYQQFNKQSVFSDLDGQELQEEQFGRLGWKQVTYDYRTMFDFEDAPLTAEDFEFSSLRIEKPARYRYAKLENGSWDYKSDTTLPVPDLTIEYRIDPAGAWQSAATAVWGDDGFGELHFTQIGTGVTVSGATLHFPENATNFRCTFISNVFNGKMAERCDIAGIEWTVFPTAVLKSTERVRGIVQKLFESNETPATKVKNDVMMDVYGWVGENNGGELVFGGDFDTARATLEGTRYGVSMSSDSTYETDVENQQIILHYTNVVTEQSNLMNPADYETAVAEGAVHAEKHGVFYNLLPVHAAPLLDTVNLREGDVIVNAYTIENYKSTGRTLLVVEAELQPQVTLTDKRGHKDQIKMTFDAVYPWQDLKEHGDELTNYSVFESLAENLPEGTIGTIAGQKGEPDDPAGGKNNSTPSMPADIRRALKDIDPNTDENRFLYGKTTNYINVLAYTVSGLEKTVKNDLEGVWSQGLDGQQQITVYEGHTYTYRLRISSAEDTATKDIVIYDSIENYRIPDPESDEDSDITKADDFLHAKDRMAWTGDWQGKGQWRGTLLSVDLSTFVRAGAAPVLYYSTRENLQFSADADDANYNVGNRELWKIAQLSDAGVWQVPEGIGVTAVAIDISKGQDGTDFVLKPEQSLSGYLNMRAPDDGGDKDVWNAKGAYARVLDADGAPVLDEYGAQQIDWDAAMDPANNMYAHNNARVRLVQGRTDNENGTVYWQNQHRLIRNDYTRVGLIPSVLTLEKIWQDQNNHDAMRPESVTIALLRRIAGEAGEDQPVLDEDGNPVKVVLDESNDWKTVFRQMPLMNAQGEQYLYNFKEEPVEGYETKVQFVAAGRYKLLNVHPNEQITAAGVKIWSDEDNAYGARPQKITLILFRDGVQIAKKTVLPNENGEWKYSFGNLDKYADGGREYVYTIEEEYVPKYATEIEGLSQIVNTYHPMGDLEVSKKLVNATPLAAEKAFEFKLVLLAEAEDENTQREPLLEEYPYTVSELVGEQWMQLESGMIGNGGVFCLKQNQKLLITGLPSETAYEVTESETPGFTVSATGAKGEIKAGCTALAEFTNIYHASGSVKLSVDKKLTGQVIAKNQFRFDLIDMNEGSETYGEIISFARVENPKEDATTGGTGEKEIESLTQAPFGDLEFTQADDGKTFRYQIREADDGRAGYTADERVYDMTVEVSDNGDGTLKLTTVLTDAQGAVDTLKFENKYEASGEITLKAWKYLEGRQLKDAEFTFELYRYDVNNNGLGEMISAAANNEAGEVVFDALQFTQKHISTDKNKPAEYSYLIRERRGTDATVIYSDQEYVITVAVADNGDGTLSFEQKDTKQYVRTYSSCEYCAGTGEIASVPCENCRGEGVVSSLVAGEENVMPVFVNRLNPGGLAVTKRVEGENSANQLFTFTVELSSASEQLDYSYQYADADADATPAPGTTPAPGATPAPTPGGGAAPAPTSTALTGKAYAALNRVSGSPDYGTLVLFRSDSSTPVDPWGNTFTSTGTFNGITYYSINENSSSISQWPWYYNSSIKKIRVDDPIKVKTCRQMFRDLPNLEEADLRNLDTSAAISMNLMFANCRKLKKLDISEFNTANVTNFTGMFDECNSLKVVDLSNFDFSGTTTLQEMFMYAFGVEEIRFGESGKTMGNVKTFTRMFSKCYALESIDLSTLDTGSATNIEGMFYDCPILKSVKLGSIDTSKVTKMECVFQSCPKLENIDLSRINTSSVTNMRGMFHGCSSLKTLDLSNFDTSKVTTMEIMFDGCTNLTTLDISSFDTTKVTNMNNMFRNCKKLQTVSIGDKTKLSVYPSASTVAPYDGKWQSVDNMDVTLSNSALFTTGGNAGTWTWNKPAYKLIFDPSEGSGAMPAVLPLVGADYSFAPDFYRFGYDIAGFVDGNGNYYACNNGVCTVPANAYSEKQIVTLTACWTARQVTVSEDGKTITFMLKAGETFAIDDLPAGTVYKVTEEGVPGWSLVSKVNDIGVIEPLESKNAVFTNKYDTGAAVAYLSASKLLDGEPADEGTFTFALYDSDGNVLETVQNGSAGSVTFNPIRYTQKGVYKYVIAETPAADTDGSIAYDTTIYKAVVTVTSEDGRLKASVAYTDENGNAPEGIPVFRNFTEPGALKIAKSVRGEMSNASAEQEFEFLLTLKDERFSLWNGLILADGEMASVVEGRLEFSLRGGETVTLSDIPAGLSYSVKEKVPDGWKQVMLSNTDGMIEANKTAEVEFVNEYTMSGSAAITLSKVLIGREPQKDEFTFRLMDADGNVIDTATNNADGSILFDRISYHEEGSYTYTVQEVPGNDAAIMYSSESLEVTVTMTDAEGNGVLVPEIVWKDGINTVTNRLKTGKLTVRKQVASSAVAHAEKAFVFAVTLMDADGEPLSGTYPTLDGGTITFTQGKAELQLKHDESVTISELPSGARYTVTEKEEPGYTVVFTGAEGTVAVDGDHEAAFVNTYEAYGEVSLKAVKRMIGGELAADEFTFAVLGNNGQGLRTAGNAADGQIAFESILYYHGADHSDVGEHTYMVKELLPEDEERDERISYDERIYRVTVTVSDNGDGTLTAEYTVELNGEEKDAVVFENVVNVCEFTVCKEWRGGSGPIQLTLYANGSKMQPQPECVRDGDTYTFVDLPVYDENGEKIVYTAKERYMEGYITIYKNPAPYQNETKVVYDGGVIINKSIVPVDADFSVRKVWKGLDDGEKAPEIRLVLYCNGEATDIKTPVPDRDGWYHYTDLPEEVNGEPAVYTVREASVNGFRTEYRLANGSSADHADNGGVITNIRIPKTGDGMPLAMLTALMGISAAAMLIILKRRKA